MIFPVHAVIFYVFTALLIAAATAMITAKNPVQAVLLLVVAFFASAVLWMLMQAEFLALVLIFVYVGAVMTLFLFVVMMLRTETVSTGFTRYYPLALLPMAVLVGTAFYVFASSHWAASGTLPTHYPSTYNNVVVMGLLLFQKYVFAFELASILLLVGMISAIALAFHGKKMDTRSQSIAEQLKANKADRLRVIDLK
jgi:NADH-quinone oxidoreductase subunit J